MPVVVVLLFLVLALAIVIVLSFFSVSLFLKVFRTLARTIFGGESVQSGMVPASVRRSLREARAYAQKIRLTVNQHPDGPVRDRLGMTIKPVDEWLTNLGRLEQALGKMYAQCNLTRELRQVNFEIEQLHRQLLDAEADELASLRALMSSKQKHKEALRQLQLFQTQAERRIQKIASDLGATHAEMLLISARGKFNDGRLQRLDEDLREQVTGLRDMLSVMDEMGYSRVY
jgi:hypothetical protein